MPFYTGNWYLPSNANRCATINYTLTCDYAAYSGNRELTQSQKLTPNTDITGSEIINAFVATTAIALLLSLALILDKIKYHFYHKGRSANANREGSFYLQLIHTTETLLQTLSDQQLVAGIALLAALNAQACTVTAYHFNLVCTMFLLSAITHLNTLINIPDFIFKGKTVAFYRLGGISIQLVLTGIVLSSRNTQMFPTKPSPLAIMPAACFENMNATNSLGFSDFFNVAKNITHEASNTTATANATEIWDNLQAATSATNGLASYIALIVFTGFAVIFLVAEFIDAMYFPSTYLHWFSIILSIISVTTGMIITIIEMHKYNVLRSGMEIAKWFDDFGKGKWTFSQILPTLLLGSGSIAIAKAVTESIAGHKARRYIDAAQKAANEVINAANRAQNDYNMVEKQAIVEERNINFTKLS